jgi:hypothetical protein
MALHATTVSGDFELTADGSTTATSNDYNDFGIIFNYQDANNFYFAHFAETNDATGGGVFKVAAGTQTRLVAFTPTVTPGTTYAVKVTKTGSAIEAFLNNATLGSATDSTFTGGKVGLGSRNDSAIFDNLIVTTSGGGPTYRAADINEDNVVNIFDLSILITNFGRNASTWTDPRANVYDEAGDTDVVNIFDLSALLSAFGT